MRQRTEPYHENQLDQQMKEVGMPLNAAPASTSHHFRSANAAKLKDLLDRADNLKATRSAAGGGMAASTSSSVSGKSRGKRSAATSYDYLDFSEKFCEKWVNVAGALLICGSLGLLYIMWFTGWIH